MIDTKIDPLKNEFNNEFTSEQWLTGKKERYSDGGVSTCLCLSKEKCNKVKFTHIFESK